MAAPLFSNPSASLPYSNLPEFYLLLLSLAHTPGQTHYGAPALGRWSVLSLHLWGSGSQIVAGGRKWWWAGFWVWLCPGTGTDDLQTPYDGFPLVKTLGVWEVYRLVVVGPDLEQRFEGLAVIGRGGGNRTELRNCGSPEPPQQILQHIPYLGPVFCQQGAGRR